MAKVWDVGVVDCCVAEDALPVDVFTHFQLVTIRSTSITFNFKLLALECLFWKQ